jgi:hypothetical protein
MSDEREYGVGQGESVLTVVQRTPVGVEVTQGVASDPEVQHAIAADAIPGVEVEVIVTDLAAAHPLARVADETPEPEPVVGPQAGLGPVGPDPEQEAAKRVAVPKRTAAKSRKS